MTDTHNAQTKTHTIGQLVSQCIINEDNEAAVVTCTQISPD